PIGQDAIAEAMARRAAAVAAQSGDAQSGDTQSDDPTAADETASETAASPEITEAVTIADAPRDNDVVDAVPAVVAPTIAGDAPPVPARTAGPDEPLIKCLAYMARHYGNPQPAEALVAGLPIAEQGLSWETFERATDRAGLTVERVNQKLHKFSEQELPAILVLKGGQAVVLTGIKKVGRKKSTYWAEIIDPAQAGPDGGAPIERTFKELAGDYSGVAILVRPDTVAEDIVDGVTSKSPNAWFWSAFLPSAWIYRQVLLGTIFINLFALTMPLFIMNVYDRVVPNNAVETLWALAIGVAVAGLLDFVLRGLRSYFVDIASRRADVTLANRIFDRVLGAGLAFKGQSSGARANVLREYETLRDFFNSATLSTFGDIPFIFLFVFVIWLVAGNIALVPLLTVPIVIVIVLLTQIPLNRIIAQSFATAAEKNSVLFETLNGLETLKSLGAESWAADKWERSVAESIRTSVKSRLISSISLNVIVVAQVLSAVAIMVLGVASIHEGEITAGALIAAVILSARTIAPLGQVAGVLSQLYRARLAYKALRMLMEAPQERPRKARFVFKPALEGDVEFRDLTFTYPNEKTPALRNISFTIKAGEKVAILGPIGSGKSTALKLLLKLYEPDSGSVMLDDIDASHVDPAMIRANVGYMPQNAQLFSGTIRTNIALHAPHSGDEELVRAARQSGALEWINQRSAGFDAPVGERGDGLSGGQRQSVALARAFLRDPPVLLLDEPTSDMDSMSEKVFIEQMKTHAAGKTVIVVTHRPALLELVDRLIVLDRSGVQADGPKDQVMAALTRRSAQKKGQLAPSAPVPDGDTVPTSNPNSDAPPQAAAGRND
ncbi:MAG: type I secretion system permease/ATPase, partial [Alphaproteobacteria bacterium]|nr:type I secretion system permease/ATPase [Alphaproteobacteria bacterium]